MSGFWYSSPTLRQYSASCRARSASSLYCSLLLLGVAAALPELLQDLLEGVVQRRTVGLQHLQRVLERSWFCSRRAVSGGEVHAPLRPVGHEARHQHPAEGVTSILDCSGVSIGTSTKEAQQAESRRTGRSARATSSSWLAVAFVIGFPEKVVVLLDVDAAWLRASAPSRRTRGPWRTPLPAPAPGQVVEGRRVVGVQGDRRWNRNRASCQRPLRATSIPNWIYSSPLDEVPARDGRAMKREQQEGEPRHAFLRRARSKGPFWSILSAGSGPKSKAGATACGAIAA